MYTLYPKIINKSSERNLIYLLIINNEEVQTGSKDKIKKAIRVLDFLGLVQKDRKVEKLEEYVNGSTIFKLIDKPKNMFQLILEHLINRSNDFFEAKDPHIRELKFANREDSFLFSIALTMLSMEITLNIWN